VEILIEVVDRQQEVTVGLILQVFWHFVKRFLGELGHWDLFDLVTVVRHLRFLLIFEFSVSLVNMISLNVFGLSLVYIFKRGIL
jgi:hypothetical protein